jgi:hypothetical protein
MKKRINFGFKQVLPVILVIIVVVVLLFWSFQSIKKRATPVPTEPQPTKGEIFKPGTKWVYLFNNATTLTVEITGFKKVDNQRALVYRSHFPDNKGVLKLYEVHDENGLFIIGSDLGPTEVIYNPPLTVFKYPFKVGKNWKNAYVRSDRPDLKFISESKITSYKEVVVPAGRFFCYRIEHLTYPVDNPENQKSTTDWYSPQVGLVKQINNNPEIGLIIRELATFTLNY